MIDNNLQKELHEKWNPEGSVLRNAQVRMLEILESVDIICKSHGINYWLSYGTLLGAVRHNGFIPWDDDLDIEMLEEDYKVLIPILERELPKNLCLQNRKHERNFLNNFTKVRDKKSQIVEGNKNSARYKEHGLFIDIFPLKRTWYPLTVFAGYIHYCCHKLSSKGSEPLHYISLFISWILYNILCPIFNFLSIFKKDDSLHITYGTFFFQERRLSEIFPLSTIKFESKEFPCPHNYDAYLTRLYGNYMQLPKEIHIHIKDNNIKIW